MRQDLLDRLSDQSVAQRYEFSEYTQTSTSENHGDRKAEIDTDFRLNNSQAMELTRINNNSHAHVEYPSWTYLTLRHDQNSSWAQSQFDKGVSYAKAALHESAQNNHALVKKAESCYKSGLEMIPNHVQILTAFGALCINDGRLEHARDLLERALRYGNEELGQFQQQDHQHSNNGSDVSILKEMLTRKKTDLDKTLEDARTYMSVVESKFSAREKIQLSTKKRQRVTMSNKAEKAMNDALAERAFMIGDDPVLQSIGTKTAPTGDYELLSSSEDEKESSNNRRDSRSHSRRDRKRRKKDSKHRRRRERSESRRIRRRREKYGDGGSGCESNADSISSNAGHSSDDDKYRYRKRRKKKSRRKTSSK